mmetsp:Transcript_63006/g.165203  ORF Transcript_63006/g.165203 Transcript_63006/m.165203 type:complete len:91 (-) Transcript_63006:262-534(-)
MASRTKFLKARSSLQEQLVHILHGHVNILLQLTQIVLDIAVNAARDLRRLILSAAAFFTSLMMKWFRLILNICVFMTRFVFTKVVDAHSE